jgi:hypothetical protein
MTLKHISEFPTTGISFPFTITHSGKLSLLERSYERFKHSNNFQDTIDNVYMFFTHAFHMKEWIQHFSGKRNFQENWKANYADNEYYLLCQDFCNKSKHFKLSRPEVTNDIALIQRDDYSCGDKVTIFYIKYADHFIEVDVLMKHLIDFWKNYFRKEL